jgi:predicted ester cyclase
MTGEDLKSRYSAYLDCLNRQDWQELGSFVSETVVYNDRPIGLAGYREMLKEDYRAIPDLHFNAELVTVDPRHVACRLAFDCTPVGLLFGLPVNGRRVQFHENVFYRFDSARIAQVWSIIDQAAIALQLAQPD